MRQGFLYHDHGYAATSGLFAVSGSFGVIDGRCKPIFFIDEDKTVGVCETSDVLLRSVTREVTEGVFLRADTLTNKSDREIIITGLLSRFTLEGGDYDVYTQFSNWQNESLGGWQPLVTGVRTTNNGIRLCESAAPILALYSRLSKKSYVFHLIPNAQWELSANRRGYDTYDVTVVETGFSSDALFLHVAPGETIDFPQIIYFECDDRESLDCYKLHEVFRVLNPKTRMPLAYNSWLYRFDNFDYEGILAQINCAERLGTEYFVIDAGWFGTRGNWFESVGDWKETSDSATNGRMTEIADEVRRHGMKFGLWFEPERAGTQSAIIKKHPEYFFENRFLNFANDAAREYITDALSEIITRYDIQYIKLDFNAALAHDPLKEAFYRYFTGHAKFLRDLRERFPDIYMTACSSGGFRLDLRTAMLFDSIQPSDNMGLREGLSIYAETLKRLPPQFFERWICQRYEGKFPDNPLLFTCNDAGWQNVVSDDPTRAIGFMIGGPVFLSTDLTTFPESYNEKIKATFDEIRRDRDFFLGASVRILGRTKNYLCLQYADDALHKNILLVFADLPYRDALTVYPVLNPDTVYSANGEEKIGRIWMRDGILLGDIRPNSCIRTDIISKSRNSAT